jgi:4-amino-4-deoxy-L-arabinose transferase-like glycosyltransferase
MLGGTAGRVAAIRFSTAFWGLGILLMTYLLIRRVLGYGFALPGTALLATMMGFVENTHWIRVDVALAFFVAASI